MDLSLKIVSVDSYLAKPIAGYDPIYSHFTSSGISHVPILRVFGITPSGSKGCVHVHGVFPYLFVPVPKDEENIDGFKHHLATQLNDAINSTGENNRFSGGQHIFKITVVKGLPFYGYNSQNEDFFKIYLFRPYLIRKCAALLQSGTICGRRFQPHEAHVPYTQQFFIDFNLYGMSPLLATKYSQRQGTMTPSAMKVTRCAFEADVNAEDITNHTDINGRDVKNPGLAYIWEDEKARRRNEGQTSQISFTHYDNVNVGYRSRMEEDLLKQLRDVLKNRIHTSGRTLSLDFSSNETSVTNASFIDNHALDKTYPLLDSQDLELLEGIGVELEDDRDASGVNVHPEDDSILGSQQIGVLDSSMDENEEQEGNFDLTIPFEVSDSDQSDGESSNNGNAVEITIRYPSDDSGAESDIIFLDGNVDDSSDSSKVTPSKRKKKQKPPTPTRYNPLGIRIQKSPFKTNSTLTEEQMDLKEQESSFELSQFMRLQQIASSFPDTSNFSNSFSDLNQSKVKSNLNQAAECATSGFTSFPDPEERNIPSAKKTLLFGPSDVDSQPTKLTSSQISASSDELFPAPVAGPSGLNCESQLEIGGIISSSTTSDSATNQSFKYFTTILNPPHPESIIKNLDVYGFNGHLSKKPFYGCSKDLSSKKEVGRMRISVMSNFARDLEEHKAVTGNGMTAMHENMFSKLISLQGSSTTETPKASQILQSLASNRSVQLTPLFEPPTRSEIEKWLDGMKQSKISLEELLHRPIIVDETSNPAMLSQSTIFDSQASVLESEGSQAPRQSQMVREESSSGSKLSPMIAQRRASCLIDEATANNSGAFKMDFQNLQEATSASMFTFLTLCAMELHVNSRASLRPNPEYDSVEAIFYTITNDVPADIEIPLVSTGIIMVDNSRSRLSSKLEGYSVVVVQSERELFENFITIIQQHDPDIFAGYEIEMASWGYLIHRGYIIGFNMCNELSRLLESSNFKPDMAEFRMRDLDVKISGRIILNVWRMMRHEVSLMSYSFENMAYHILHTRVPYYSYQTLTHWWNHISFKKRILTIKFYLTRVSGIVKLLDSLNLIGRTSEMASLFGIQFYEVLSRGSQFRVESMMLRLAKPMNYIAVSPSVQQRADMRAPACLPLIMEPESRFYSDPVIVLDFQSLYPSMMIAYNYCFSTCLGRVEELLEADKFKFGCTELCVDAKELYKMKDSIHISPAGIAFVGKKIRKGVLPCMLDEILETRLMVKKSMKAHKNNNILRRVLDARQMGLKLIANVTYGYTSANFSGRMPCIEVGDSVVSKGRETLERAIKLVKETASWRASVVYGDTDSMFILCPGRTKEEAFVIGQEIADAVTNSNPRPVKLKLEKVYQPCILQTKKRYVGYMYESADQETPVFEAKGIETVRRDGCMAVAKVLEKSLRILFETYDVSRVRQYVSEQLIKISSSKLNLQDLIFAREYRGMKGYKPNACVPALQLVRDWLSRDPRAEPRVGERVGYCIVYGPPGVPLIQLVRDPKEVLKDPNAHINSEYYITKVILPPLQRCFTLLGVDTFSWYKMLPKIRKTRKRLLTKTTAHRATMSQFFATVNCIICDNVTTAPVCSDCHSDQQMVVSLATMKTCRIQRKEFLLNKLCGSCCGRSDDLQCASMDCPIYYRKCLVASELPELEFLQKALDEF